MKYLDGSLRRRTKNGSFFFRITPKRGIPRKEYNLETDNLEEARKKADEIVRVLKAPSKEVALAQIKAIHEENSLMEALPLREAFEVYELHPDRAHPRTVHEEKSYRATYNEFVEFVTNPLPEKYRRARHTIISNVAEITPEVCDEYAAYLKITSIAVDTHNRKFKRLGKIFDCLKDYYALPTNPFRAKGLRRKKSEEQGDVIHRQAFTKEQEQAILAAFQDPKNKIKNKDEVRVIYTLGMYTGQRLKDCTLMKWQDIDLLHGVISIHQFKTGKFVSIPIAPELQEALMEAKTWEAGQYVCPNEAEIYNRTDDDGKNIGNNLVDLAVLRVIRWIGLKTSVTVPGRKKKMTMYGFHSLRHSFCSFCAEAGVPKAVLVSILGTE